MNRAKAGCALHRFSANANPACAWMSNVNGRLAAGWLNGAGQPETDGVSSHIGTGWGNIANTAPPAGHQSRSGSLPNDERFA